MGALYEIAHIFYLGSVVFVLLYIIEGRAENQWSNPKSSTVNCANMQ